MAKNAQQAIKTWNSWLILVAIVATLCVNFYLAKAWTHNAAAWWNFTSYYLWVLVPYFIFIWLNITESKTKNQALTTLILLLMVILAGIFGYIVGVYNAMHPKHDIHLLMLPLYQLIISIIAIPLVIAIGSVRR